MLLPLFTGCVLYLLLRGCVWFQLVRGPGLVGVTPLGGGSRFLCLVIVAGLGVEDGLEQLQAVQGTILIRVVGTAIVRIKRRGSEVLNNAILVIMKVPHVRSV